MDSTSVSRECYVMRNRLRLRIKNRVTPRPTVRHLEKAEVMRKFTIRRPGDSLTARNFLHLVALDYLNEGNTWLCGSWTDYLL